MMYDTIQRLWRYRRKVCSRLVFCSTCLYDIGSVTRFKSQIVEEWRVVIQRLSAVVKRTTA